MCGDTVPDSNSVAARRWDPGQPCHPHGSGPHFWRGTRVCAARRNAESPAQQPITPAPPDPAIAAALRTISPRPDPRRHREAGQLSQPQHDQQHGKRSSARHRRAGRGRLDRERVPAYLVAACGNCLEVKRDDFVEPPQTGPTARIKQPTRIVNVYAVLRGLGSRAGEPARAGDRPL